MHMYVRYILCALVHTVEFKLFTKFRCPFLTYLPAWFMFMFLYIYANF